MADLVEIEILIAAVHTSSASCDAVGILIPLISNSDSNSSLLVAAAPWIGIVN